MLVDLTLEPGWPRHLHEHAYPCRRGKTIEHMIEEAGGKESENERARCAPEPEILMQCVQQKSENCE
jgi:hypothetical protein